MLNRRVGIFFIGSLALTMIALAAPVALNLYVNGQPYGQAVKVEGREVYVAASALKAAGAEVTITDSKVSVQFKPMREKLQTNAVEGVKDEWVQNEMWRVKVSGATPITNPFGRGPGFQVTVEMRNLSTKKISVYGSGLDKVQVIDSNGNTLSFNPGSFKDQFTDLAQANGFKNDLKFGDQSNALKVAGTPDKILFLFRNSGGKKLKDIRISLKDE